MIHSQQSQIRNQQSNNNQKLSLRTSSSQQQLPVTLEALLLRRARLTWKRSRRFRKTWRSMPQRAPQNGRSPIWQHPFPRWSQMRRPNKSRQTKTRRSLSSKLRRSMMTCVLKDSASLSLQMALRHAVCHSATIRAMDIWSSALTVSTLMGVGSRHAMTTTWGMGAACVLHSAQTACQWQSGLTRSSTVMFVSFLPMSTTTTHSKRLRLNTNLKMLQQNHQQQHQHQHSKKKLSNHQRNRSLRERVYHLSLRHLIRWRSKTSRGNQLIWEIQMSPSSRMRDSWINLNKKLKNQNQTCSTNYSYSCLEHNCGIWANSLL